MSQDVHWRARARHILLMQRSCRFSILQDSDIAHFHGDQTAAVAFWSDSCRLFRRDPLELSDARRPAGKCKRICKLTFWRRTCVPVARTQMAGTSARSDHHRPGYRGAGKSDAEGWRTWMAAAKGSSLLMARITGISEILLLLLTSLLGKIGRERHLLAPVPVLAP